jgi:hypothetical protein
MQLYADLKKDYNLLKFKLGRIPMMMDFIEHGSRDPYLFVDYSNSYYNFFLKVEKLESSELTAQEIKILELFAKEINNGKRIVECYILKSLIELESIDFEKIKTVVSTNYNYKISKSAKITLPITAPQKIKGARLYNIIATIIAIIIVAK